MDSPAPESHRRIAVCPNCDTPVNGPYCATCGQQQTNLNKYFWTLAGEALDEVFRPNSRTVRTLIPLVFRPGYLTTEYFAGRRARYVPPFRLYLIISFLFFIVMPFVSSLSGTNDVVIDVSNDETTEVGQPAETGSWRDEMSADTSDTRVELPWLTETENQQLTKRFQKQLEKFLDLAEEDPGALVREVMDVSSAVMFFLLPVFAILLKIVYLGSGFYYAEHLLLAIHNHCFLFLAFMLVAGLQTLESTPVGAVTDTAVTVISFWLPVYMYLSMKHTYQHGPVVTFFAFCLLSAGYLVLAVAGMIAALLFSIMLA